MKTISVVNYKGGVGKTTFVANIAAKLAEEGKKVLLIDLDPQGSLTFSFMNPDEWQEKYSERGTIKNWYDNKLNRKSTSLEDFIVRDLLVNKKYTSSSPISLIPSHFELCDISLELALNSTGFTRRLLSKSKIESLFTLKRGLEEINESYDYAFIDCQPSFDLLTQNAIVASDYYLIPTKLDNLSTLGIDSLILHINKLIMKIKDNSKKYTFNDYKLNTKLLGVVENMVNKCNGDNKTAFNTRIESRFIKNPEYKLFTTSIRNNSEFMDTGDLIPAILKPANNKTRKSIGNELENLAIEFERRVNE